MRFKVFFSYAHRDEQLLEELKEHLAPLKNQGLIDRFWYDREINAGTEWEPEIVRHLETAHIILLLVSAAFMNSEYCYGKELQRAIQRHERREARVIPIILSPIDWKIPPLDKLQALPTDGKPITGSGWHSVPEAMLNVAQGIRIVVKNLQQHPLYGSPYQYHLNYINQQIREGNSAIEALNQCDPALGKLFESIINWQNPIILGEKQQQIEKLLQEISSVGDGDLTVQAKVTPDTLGVLADSFNYMIEELAKTIGRTRIVNVHIDKGSNQILNILRQQDAALKNLEIDLNISKGHVSSASHLSQQSKIETLIETLYKANASVGIRVSYLKELSQRLDTSISTFRLPPHTDYPDYPDYPDYLEIKTQEEI